MSKISINQINGIPLHYARTTQHPYGSIGRQQNFLVEEDFHRELEKCFGELFLHCPLGEPKVLTCAGIFVNKSGQHGHAKAFDLDAIFWEDYSLIAKNFTQDAILYLGLESFYRKYFGVVLNHFYNASHEDHWHLDISAIPERYTLLESLNSFRFHPATDAWLGQYSLKQDIGAVIDEVKLLG